MSDEVISKAIAAKKASVAMSMLSSKAKHDILYAVAECIKQNQDQIIKANKQDIELSKSEGMSEALIDRLTLTPARIDSMCDGLVYLANFADPIGEITAGFKHPNGMSISKIRVPLGVVAMIYESRPNVTIEAAALALKSSNSIILRGSRQALRTNKILCDLFVKAGLPLGLTQDAVLLIEDSSRDSINTLVKLDEYIDVLIPRGGVGLKDFIKQHATIPLIQTGAGVCHAYVDFSADLKNAVEIVKNAKTQRPSTCNSLECLLVHKDILHEFLNLLIKHLNGHVELRLHESFYNDFKHFNEVRLASDDDFGVEFLSLIMSVRSVNDVDEAIDFINTNSSGHSDAIISENYNNIEKFLNLIDSAVVYANASTRFSDGGEFGFGGEIGIATQKLHARGPMGVWALTSEKYIVRGNGQIRS